MLLMDELARHDGVAHVRTLVAAGIPESVIVAARRSGAVARPRRGWVAASGADPDLVAAVQAGGRLGCASQARRLGLWMLDNVGLHVSLPRHSGHTRPPEHATVHWRGREWGSSRAPHDPPGTVVRDLVDCLPLEAAVCAIDSALNLRIVSPFQLSELLGATRRGSRIAALVDRRAESGLETLTRIRLRAAGIPTAPQVVIAGVGRVDLLIGDRLVIECDGRAHHDDPLARARDRERDLRLAAAGCAVLRLDVQQILSDWPATEAVIRALISRGEHRWRRAHRQERLSGG